jgi:regulator of replication initiation timing
LTKKLGVSQETLTKNLFCELFLSRNLDKNAFIGNKGYIRQGLPMKRKASAIVLIAIVALSVTTWIIYYQISELQSQNSDLQNQVNELQDQNRELQDQNSELQDQLIELEKKDAARDVKITHFEWKGGYHHLGQVNLFQAFKVTIENMGDNNVSGLTVSVELLSVRTNAKIDEYTTQIGFIRAGEIEEIGGFVSVGVIGRYAHTAVGVITLSYGDVLLDQLTLNLEGSF